VKKLLRLLPLGVVALGFLPGTGLAEQVLTIPGTGASAVMLRALGEAFAKERPGVKVDIPASVGSGGGIKAAGEGKAELGRVARKIKEKEEGFGLTYVPYAKVPVVFVAHSGIKLRGLTSAQVTDIFSGKATNWKEVGGPDKRIRVVTRPDGESTIDTLRASLKPWADVKMTQMTKVTDSEQQTAATLASVDGAIGYTVYDLAIKSGLTVFTLDGVTPTDDAYPAQMQFALVHKVDKFAGVAKEFVDFLFTPAAVKIIKAHGADPISR
jgi:phosphate transport system substrate-binding protein